MTFLEHFGQIAYDYFTSTVGDSDEFALFLDKIRFDDLLAEAKEKSFDNQEFHCNESDYFDKEKYYVSNVNCMCDNEALAVALYQVRIAMDEDAVYEESYYDLLKTFYPSLKNADNNAIINTYFGNQTDSQACLWEKVRYYFGKNSKNEFKLQIPNRKQGPHRNTQYPFSQRLIKPSRVLSYVDFFYNHFAPDEIIDGEWNLFLEKFQEDCARLLPEQQTCWENFVQSFYRSWNGQSKSDYENYENGGFQSNRGWQGWQPLYISVDKNADIWKIFKMGDNIPIPIDGNENLFLRINRNIRNQQIIWALAFIYDSQYDEWEEVHPNRCISCNDSLAFLIRSMSQKKLDDFFKDKLSFDKVQGSNKEGRNPRFIIIDQKKCNCADSEYRKQCKDLCRDLRFKEDEDIAFLQGGIKLDYNVYAKGALPRLIVRGKQDIKIDKMPKQTVKDYIDLNGCGLSDGEHYIAVTNHRELSFSIKEFLIGNWNENVGWDIDRKDNKCTIATNSTGTLNGLYCSLAEPEKNYLSPALEHLAKFDRINNRR